ncbi:helix-turn-helix domain-containing protein [Kitasatospora sp. RG8]|uniref:helix-turn-helix domain-containing protein n=1 Tax=Kitasatospora sp. RG8 TaxID=2820815 RepID=UPI0027DC8457|nr:AraC family transcriptional regulator [Kitasatospora sp. RG8]
MAAVAGRWGFASASHFSRAFRAAYGVSPREWQAASGRAPSRGARRCRRWNRSGLLSRPGTTSRCDGRGGRRGPGRRAVVPDLTARASWSAGHRSVCSSAT